MQQLFAWTQTCQVQPQFEHEIFQPNIRPQNCKESNFQEKLKTLFVRNLSLCLKFNCCVKIVLPKSGLSRGCAFITATDHVCTEQN